MLTGALACALVTLVAGQVGASGLLAAAVGPADQSTSGASVAEPLSPSGALFANPAGLLRFPTTTYSASVGVAGGTERVRSPDPPGYDESNDVLALVPDLAVSIAGRGRLHYGIGVFGSVGMNYDFEAQPEAGVDDGFFSECSIAGLPLAVAYRASERLWLGAELVPLFGYLRNHYVLADFPFRYKLTGPGIQGMLGATWNASEQWSFGLGFRTPGRIWLDGSAPAASGGRQDVDLEIHMPAQISVGITRHFGQRFSLDASGRWTDSSTFSDSIIDFAKMPQADVPFVPHANDEWRGALGARLAWTPRLELRAGVSYANRIVGTKGVSPLLFDNDDLRLTGGVGIELSERWTLDVMGGYMFEEERTVSADDALILPGRYEMSGYTFLIGLQRRL